MIPDTVTENYAGGPLQAEVREAPSRLRPVAPTRRAPAPSQQKEVALHV